MKAVVFATFAISAAAVPIDPVETVATTIADTFPETVATTIADGFPETVATTIADTFPTKVATTIADTFPTKVATTIADNLPPAEACPSHPPKPPTGPKINIIFFSDEACQNTVPETIYTRDIFGSVPCYNDFPNQSYKSLIIDHIDDQIIGTNTALQVGVASSDQCDFTESLRFNVATRDLVGKCQFIGIPQGQGKLLGAGNEYRLTNLQ